MKGPILIVACGNPDAGDDGFGHSVAENLRAEPLPGITIAEIGTRPLDLFDLMQAYASLIIADAVHYPSEKPGSLIDIDWFDPGRPVLKSETVSSTHGIPLGQQLELGRTMGMLPPVVRLVGANIGQARIGSPMTRPVRRCVPDAVRIIKRHIVRE